MTNFSGSESPTSSEPLGKKPPQHATVTLVHKILVSREEAAQLLSIIQRALDYFVATNITTLSIDIMF
jgi:hypothetical protein